MIQNCSALAGNSIALLPTYLFRGLSSLASVDLGSMFDGKNCTAMHGVAASIVGSSYCSYSTAMGVVDSNGNVAFSCSKTQDAFVLPAGMNLRLATTVGCTHVVRILLPGSRIGSVAPSFLVGLPNVLELDLSMNPITVLPAGFGDRLLASAWLLLTGTPAMAPCSDSAFVQTAPGTNQQYCEEYALISTELQRTPEQDRIIFTVPSDCGWKTSIAHLRLGLLSPYSLQMDTPTFTMAHADVPLSSDGLAAELTAQPTLKFGRSKPISFRWTLSVFSPQAILIDRPPTITNRNQSRITLRCSRAGCAFSVVLDEQPAIIVRQSSASSLMFQGSPLVAAGPPLAAIQSVLSVPVPVGAFYALDSQPPRQSLTDSVQLQTAAGVQQLVLWVVDNNGIKQPISVGLWWHTRSKRTVAYNVIQVSDRWLAIGNATTNTLQSIHACVDFSCSNASWTSSKAAIPVTGFGLRMLHLEILDWWGEAFGVSQAGLAIWPKIAAPESWTLYSGLQTHTSARQHASVAPLPGLKLEVISAEAGHLEEGTYGRILLPFHKPGTWFFNIRQVNHSQDFSMSTTLTWRSEPCGAALNLLPKSSACSAAGTSYCKDEPVFGILQTNCSVSLQQSADNGVSWQPVSPGLLMVSTGAPPAIGAASLRIRWADAGREIATTASWTRADRSAFAIELKFTCAPAVLVHSSTALFCIYSGGWQPPGSVVQFKLDQEVWQDTYWPSVARTALSPGWHTAHSRVFHQRYGTLASAAHSWEVLPTEDMPWTVWASRPQVMSWSEIDTIAWASPGVPVLHFQVRVNNSSAWVNTTKSQLLFPGSINTPVQTCVSVRAVSSVGVVGDELQYCWWNLITFMSIAVASSNGDASHSVFNASDPVEILWQPISRISGVHGVQFQWLSGPHSPGMACADSGKPWVATPDMRIHVPIVSQGWHQLVIRSVGLADEVGPLTCHNLFAALGLPEVAFQQVPATAVSDATVLVTFRNATPSATPWYWFECLLEQPVGTCSEQGCLASWMRCLSPLSVGPLAVGPYTLHVRANDPNGRSSRAATCSWAVEPASESAVQLPALANGPHRVMATAFDDAGKVGNAVIAEWVVDTEPPIISQFALEPQPHCTQQQHCFVHERELRVLLRITDAPRDPYGCAACHYALNLTICANSECMTTLTNHAGLNVTISTVQEGAYVVTLLAQDPANNSVLAGCSQFLVDRTPPSPRVSLSGILPTWQGLPVINTPYANVSLVSDSGDFWTVGLHQQNDAIVDSGLLGISGQQLLSVRIPAEGITVLVVNVSDSAGNAAQPARLSVIRDVSGPLSFVTRQSPPIVARRAVISVRTSDTTTAVVNCRVQHEDSTSTMTFLSPCASFDVNSTVEGSHAILVRAVDVAGNVEARGAQVSWVVDRSPPSTRIAVQEGAETRSDVLHIGLSGADTISWVVGWRLLHEGPDPDGVVATIVLSRNNNTATNATIAAVREGIHRLIATAFDVASNYDSVGASVTITVDHTAPSTAAQRLQSTEASRTTAYIQLGGQDAWTSIMSWHVKHTRLPDLIESFAVTAVHGAAVIRLEHLSEGWHRVHANAVDGVGNIDTSGAAVEWLVDTMPPVTTALMMGKSPTRDTAVQIMVSATDQLSAIVSFSWYHFDPLGALAAQGTVSASNGTGVVQIISSVEGTHHLLLTAQDMFSNTDSIGARVSWTHDASPPRTNVTVVGDAVTANPSALLMIESEDTISTIVEWKISHAGPSAMWPPTVDCPVGVHAVHVAVSQLAEGVHEFGVVAKDRADNVERQSTVVFVVVDLSAPATSISVVGPAARALQSTVINLGGRDSLTGVAYWAVFHQGPGVTAFPSIVHAVGANSSVVTVEGCASGHHTMCAYSVDLVGNKDSTGACAEWTTDRDVPTLALAPHDPLTSATSMLILAVASDQTTWVRSIDWSMDGGASNNETLDASQAALVIAVQTEMEGRHCMQAAAVDAVGNRGDLVNVTWTSDFSPPLTTSTVVHPAISNDSHAHIDLVGFDAISWVDRWVIRHEGPRATHLEQVVSTSNSNAAALSISNMDEGVHRFQVQAVDAVGHHEHSWITCLVVVDLGAPTTTIQLQTPNITRLESSALFLDGNDTVTTIDAWHVIYEGNGAVLHADDIHHVISSHLAVSSVAEGSHCIRAHSIDSVGHEDPIGATACWVVDWSVPISQLAAAFPAVSNLTSARFHVIGSDAVTAVRFWWLRHHFNGTATQSRLLPAERTQGVAEADAVYAVAEGWHMLSVTAVDAAGNEEVIGSSVHWLVDHTPPASDVVLDGPTVLAQRRIHLTLVGADGLSGVHSWQLSLIEGSSGALQHRSSTAASLWIEDLIDSWYEARVRAVDVAGNADPVGSAVRWVVDLTAPSTTTVLLSNQLSNVTFASLQLGGLDANGLVTSWRVQVNEHGATVIQCIATPCICVVHDLHSGLNFVTAQAIDSVGNVDPIGATTAISVDTDPPRILFSEYPPHLLASQSLHAVVNCSEEMQGVSVAIVRKDQLAQTQIWTAVQCSAVFELLSADDGIYELVAKGSDLAGNQVDQLVSGPPFTVDCTPIAEVHLQFVGGQPRTLIAADMIARTSAATIAVVVTVKDADDRSCSECVTQFSIGSTVMASFKGEFGVVDLPVSPSRQGLRVIHSMLVDEAGNTRDGPSLSVFVDTIAPQARITFTSVQNGTITNQTTLTMTLGCSKENCSYCFSGAAAVCSKTETLALSSIADGAHCVFVQAQDALLNTGFAEVLCWTVDTTPPKSAWVLPPSAIAAHSTIRGTYQVSAGVAVAVLAAPQHGAVLRKPCYYGVCSLQDLEDGAWTVWLHSVDAAGNEEALTDDTKRVIVVDSVPPILEWEASTMPPVMSASQNWTALVSVVDHTEVQLSAAVNDAGGQTVAVRTTQRGSMFQLSTSQLHDGRWDVRVSATDAAGHSSALLQWSWLVDLHPPSVELAFVPAPASNMSSIVPLYAESPLSQLTLRCQDNHGACTTSARWRLVEAFGASICGVSDQHSAVSDFQPPSQLSLAVDGIFELDLKAVDLSGNEKVVRAGFKFAVDTRAPLTPKLSVSGISGGETVLQTAIQATIVLEADISPEPAGFRFVYQLDGGVPTDVVAVHTRSPDSSWLHTALFGASRLLDGPHSLVVSAMDAAQHVSVPATFLWSVQTAAPDTVIDHRPPGGAELAASFAWTFYLSGRVSGTASIKRIEVQLDDDPTWRTVCVESSACNFTVQGARAGTHTLQARAVNELLLGDTTPASVTWSTKVCRVGEYALIDEATGTIACTACPRGGDCHGGTESALQVAALPGFWASASSQHFYKCPLKGACLGGTSGSNQTRSLCQKGYSGILCSHCTPGYYLQFGECAACPDSTTTSYAAMCGLTLVIAVLVYAAFVYRQVLPQTVMKIALAMIQIVGSSNTSFAAPWPSAFVSLASGLKFFMLELLTLTRTSCTMPFSFFVAFSFTVFGMTALSCAIVIATWLLAYKRTNRGTITGVQRPLFVFWLLCYPAVSLKLLQVFNCIYVDGDWRLVADMRISCEDSTWYTYAGVSVAYLICFTVGLPLGLTAFLYKRRASLDQRHTFMECGFLYQQYGLHAYAWEGLELTRKLLLTSALTLMDPDSVFPLAMAVMISAVAHVLHAAYKPFHEAKYYWLQHGSLSVTTTVFLIGLLLKVQTDMQGWLLEGFNMLLMTTICLMLLAFVVVGLLDFLAALQALRRAAALKLGSNSKPSILSRLSRSVHKEASTNLDFPVVTGENAPIELSNPLHRVTPAGQTPARGQSLRSLRVARASFVPASSQ